MNHQKKYWGSLLCLNIGLWSLFTFSIAPQKATGAERFSVYESPRGRMLGNAMTAKVNDFSSLYYNPAGLAGVEDWRIQIPDLQASLSGNFTDLLSKVGSLGTNPGATEFTKLAQLYVNESVHVGLNIIPIGLTFKNFAIGLLMGTEWNIGLGSQVIPSLNLLARTQVGLSVGYAISFFDDMLKIGLVGRTFGRAAVDLPINSSKLISDLFANENPVNTLLNPYYILKNNALVGLGYDGDIGMQFHIPVPSLPLFSEETSKLKIGAVVQNILNQDFVNIDMGEVSTGSITKESIHALQRTVNLGVALNFGRLLGFINTEISADYRNLLRPTNKTWGTNLAFGAEANMDLLSWLQAGVRLGINDGFYPSYGAMLRVLFITLEAGIYTPELGGYPGQKGVPRYMARVALEI